MLCADQQLRCYDDLPAAIFEVNASTLSRQKEWDAEWRQQGLASRLSPKVTNIRCLLCQDQELNHGNVISSVV